MRGFKEKVTKSCNLDLHGRTCYLRIEGVQSNKLNLFHEVCLSRITLVCEPLDAEDTAMDYEVSKGVPESSFVIAVESEEKEEADVFMSNRMLFLPEYEVLTVNKEIAGYHHGYLTEVDDALLFAGLSVQLVAETASSVRVDHYIGAFLQALEDERVAARNQEDFEMAGKLTRTIQPLLRLGKYAAELSEQKRAAVLEEDYDEAARLQALIVTSRKDAEVLIKRDVGEGFINNQSLSRELVSHGKLRKEGGEFTDVSEEDASHNSPRVIADTSEVREGDYSGNNSLSPRRTLEESTSFCAEEEETKEAVLPDLAQARPTSSQSQLSTARSRSSSKGLRKLFSRPPSATSSPRSQQEQRETYNIPTDDPNQRKSNTRNTNPASKSPRPNSPMASPRLSSPVESIPAQETEERTYTDTLFIDKPRTATPSPRKSAITEEFGGTDAAIEGEGTGPIPSPRPKRELMLPETSAIPTGGEKDEDAKQGKRNTVTAEDVNSYRTMLNQLDKAIDDNKTEASIGSVNTNGNDLEKSGEKVNRKKGKSKACSIQ